MYSLPPGFEAVFVSCVWLGNDRICPKCLMDHVGSKGWWKKKAIPYFYSIKFISSLNKLGMYTSKRPSIKKPGLKRSSLIKLMEVLPGPFMGALYLVPSSCDSPSGTRIFQCLGLLQLCEESDRITPRTTLTGLIQGAGKVPLLLISRSNPCRLFLILQDQPYSLCCVHSGTGKAYCST